jgi:hypothetical protein
MINFNWIPNLRTKLITDDGREFDNLLNAAMQTGWELPDSAMKTNYLNHKQCRSLWEHMGRTEKIPKRLGIVVNREDILRLFPLKEKGTS